MLAEASVLQKVKARKPKKPKKKKHTANVNSEDENGEEYKKKVEEDMRMWLETESCRRAVVDAYFNNPPRSHGKTLILSCAGTWF